MSLERHPPRRPLSNRSQCGNAITRHEARPPAVSGDECRSLILSLGQAIPSDRLAASNLNFHHTKFRNDLFRCLLLTSWDCCSPVVATTPEFSLLKWSRLGGQDRRHGLVSDIGLQLRFDQEMQPLRRHWHRLKIRRGGFQTSLSNIERRNRKIKVLCAAEFSN